MRRVLLPLPVVVSVLTGPGRRRAGVVEVDNVDGWTNDTGFPITRAHQCRHLRALGREAPG